MEHGVSVFGDIDSGGLSYSGEKTLKQSLHLNYRKSHNLEKNTEKQCLIAGKVFFPITD